MNYSFIVLVIVFTLQLLAVSGVINCTHTVSRNVPNSQDYCVYAELENGAVAKSCNKDYMPGFPQWPDSGMNECVKGNGYKVFLRCDTDWCNNEPCIPTRDLTLTTPSAVTLTSETISTATPTLTTILTTTAAPVGMIQAMTTPTMTFISTPSGSTMKPDSTKTSSSSTTSTITTAEEDNSTDKTAADLSTKYSNSSKNISAAACNTIISTAKDLASRLMNTLTNIGTPDGDGTTNETGALLPSNSSETGAGGQTGPGSSSASVNPDGTNTGNGGTSGQGQHYNQNGQSGQSSSSNNNQSGSTGTNPSITGSGDNSQLPPNAIRYLPITQNTCDCKCNHSSKMNTIVKQSAPSINVMMTTFLTLSVYLF